MPHQHEAILLPTTATKSSIPDDIQRHLCRRLELGGCQFEYDSQLDRYSLRGGVDIVQYRLSALQSRCQGVAGRSRCIISRLSAIIGDYRRDTSFLEHEGRLHAFPVLDLGIPDDPRAIHAAVGGRSRVRPAALSELADAGAFLWLLN